MSLFFPYACTVDRVEHCAELYYASDQSAIAMLLKVTMFVLALSWLPALNAAPRLSLAESSKPVLLSGIKFNLVFDVAHPVPVSPPKAGIKRNETNLYIEVLLGGQVIREEVFSLLDDDMLLVRRVEIRNMVLNEVGDVDLTTIARYGEEPQDDWMKQVSCIQIPSFGL